MRYVQYSKVMSSKSLKEKKRNAMFNIFDTFFFLRGCSLTFMDTKYKDKRGFIFSLFIFQHVHIAQKGSEETIKINNLYFGKGYDHEA